jgi:hypothetical protein
VADAGAPEPRGADAPAPREVEIGVYDPSQNAEALELERLCPQGTSLRLTFRRSSFHRRAENFPEWRIFTARVGGRLAGTAAVALKDAVLLGRPIRASFFFDLRVHPDFRGFRLSRRVSRPAFDWGLARSDFVYFYAVSGNVAPPHIARTVGMAKLGGYAYLVYPAYRRLPVEGRPERVSFQEAHAALLDASPPFDFYADPGCQPGVGGYLESWLLRKDRDVAGCSVWTNREILGEVVEAVPRAFRWTGALLRAPLLRRVRLPHIPRPGEELASWYLFDFFATHPALARSLLRHLAARALDEGIDYCHVPHQPGAPWVEAARSDVPRPFSPILSYALVGRTATGETPRLERVYVDVRDL